MILSKYNLYISNENYLMIYNTLSGAIVKLSCVDHNEILKSNLNDEQFTDLYNSGIIVESQKSEIEKMKNHLKNRFSEVLNDNYRFEIMVTHKCNLHCTYCYQKKIIQNLNHMDKSTIKATILFIKNTTSNSNITFYGGEPLLNYDSLFVILDNLGNRYNYTIITNGTLINEIKFKKLAEKGLKDCQITLDGLKEIHDLKRSFNNGNGTYNTILKNIIKILNFDINITIRINISNQNLKDIKKLLYYFMEIGLYKKVKFSISDVIGYDDNNCYEKIIKIYDRFSKLGFNINIPATLPCLISSGKSFTIDNKGFIYPCMYYAGVDMTMNVGNVFSGIDNEKLNRFINLTPWDDCLECENVGVCAGGCRLRASSINSKGCQKSFFRQAIEREVLATYYSELTNKEKT